VFVEQLTAAPALRAPQALTATVFGWIAEIVADDPPTRSSSSRRRHRPRAPAEATLKDLEALQPACPSRTARVARRERTHDLVVWINETSMTAMAHSRAQRTRGAEETRALRRRVQNARAARRSAQGPNLPPGELDHATDLTRSRVRHVLDRCRSAPRGPPRAHGGDRGPAPPGRQLAAADFGVSQFFRAPGGSTSR
jgi:hypothetical protein